ncbi:MAG TPA: 50S ribosomal protein L25/general stress protein Ctc [Stellaceae bacterium]|nr:50S ribosomal protein L25/general stress protein Ctc [Stellaceae bacterium]
MAELTTIRASQRDRAGKGAARATRRDGRVPGIVYGEKLPPVLISVDPRELMAQMQKKGFFARLLNVELDGTAFRALPRDVQLNPVSDKPEHVDFMRVGDKTRLTVAVPVVFENQEKSPGIRRGGILNIVRHEIELVCTADNIPETIRVDVAELDIGDPIHISQVKLPPGTRPTIARDFTVASVAAPTAVREEQAAAAAAAAAAATAAAEAEAAGIVPAVPGAPGAVPGAAPGAPAGAAPGAVAGTAPGAPASAAPKEGGGKGKG